jgi:ankyrin repeat protein
LVEYHSAGSDINGMYESGMYANPRNAGSNNSMFNYEVRSSESSAVDEAAVGSTPGALHNSVLKSLVQDYDWPGTLARIASHPMEACILGVQGRPPLHVACENDAPAVVIQSLLSAYPEASLMNAGTSSTMNPLHITCSSHHASVHVVRVLLEGGHSRQCTMRDEDGDTPLHTACRCGAPMEVLEVLLRVCHSSVYERDYEGLTPLLRLWVRYFVILGPDVIDSVRGPADLQGELGDAWNKTELLLKCAHRGSLGGSGPCCGSGTEDPCARGLVFRAVHAAAAVDCPRAVLKIAAAVYPLQLDEKDENGMTPLMIAAQAPIFKVRDLSDEGYTLGDAIYEGDNTTTTIINDDGSSSNSRDGWLPDTAAETGGGQPSVIEILLQANQHAASAAACVPDPLGRLPLHWALATGKKWQEGVKPLVEVFPEALTVMDVETKLYPFMLVAQAQIQGQDKGDIGTIYEVLRRNPAMFDGLSSMAAAAAVAATSSTAAA